uniref:Uncharacterized protein n=1 Tax=Anguilla anguilla TaxID=7936 RepID=A0A0E9UQB2_ANGAN
MLTCSPASFTTLLGYTSLTTNPRLFPAYARTVPALTWRDWTSSL